MKKLVLLFAAVALSGLVLSGCGDSNNPVGVSGLVTGIDDRPGTTADLETGIVTVLHGVPGLVVDVYVNGALTLPSFAPGTVTDPLELPEGNYDIAIVPEGGNFPADAVITGSAFLPAGANASIIAHLREDGSPTLSVFVNDVSKIRRYKARVVVRHTAAAPAVDVRLLRKFWRKAYPVRTIRDLSNPNEAQTEVLRGRFKATISPAGTNEPVFETDFLKLEGGTSYIVYAYGSLSDNTFGLLIQTIELPTWRFGGDWDDDDDDDDDDDEDDDEDDEHKDD